LFGADAENISVPVCLQMLGFRLICDVPSVSQ